MDSANIAATSQSLESAKVIPIAELHPDLPDLSTKAVGGVVTITWPYNKVEGTFAFSLAEPISRLRRKKGQVRIDFTGRAAKAVGERGLGGNDEVLLSLAGAAWEAEAVNKRRSLPGADVGWRLIYSDTLSFRIKRAETSEIEFIVVTESSSQRDTTPDPTLHDPVTTTRSPSPPVSISPPVTLPARETRTKRFNDGEFASPAFLKRARMSYGSLFEDGFDIFQEDGGILGKGRKRTRFARDSHTWRYTSRSPSPEAAPSSPQRADEPLSSPARGGSSTPRVEMADEGCQTMEQEPLSSQPPSSPLDGRAGNMAPEPVPVNIPADTPIESVPEQRTQSSSTNDWFLGSTAETTIPNPYVPLTNEIPLSHFVGPPPHLDQPNSSVYSFEGSPWGTGAIPSAFEPRNRAPFPPLHEGGALASSGFEDGTRNQAIPFDNSSGVAPIPGAASESREAANHGKINPTEPHLQSLSPPMLNTADTRRSPTIHDDPLTNYPARYLEANHPSQADQIRDQAPQQIKVTDSESNSWATINQPSKATSISSTGRLGSMDGGTPEQALVIDESDSDSDSSPEPVAVEDTVNNGRAYALDVYEDAEAEDETDAQYSDDDEPQYDAAEIGGDYDTRNYQAPDDDEDDSHDEDLQPQPLEPEFNDGESWDEEEGEEGEEEEEALDEVDEVEYDTDEQMATPDSQRVVRTNPTVIDLISSSEDESEAEEEAEGEGDTRTAEMQGLDAHIDSREILGHKPIISEDSHQETSISDEGSEILSQAPMSEPDDSSELDTGDHEYASSDVEEERADRVEAGDEDEDEDEEDVIEDEAEPETYGQEEMRISEPPEAYVKDRTESEPHPRHEDEPTDVATPNMASTHEHMLPLQSTPELELHKGFDATSGNVILEDDSATLPISAADGLEMLSRTVDEESNVRDHGVSGKPVINIATPEAAPEKQVSIKSPSENRAQVPGSPDNLQPKVYESTRDEIPTQTDKISHINLTAPSEVAAGHLHPISDAQEHPPVTVSSPPHTQPLQSGIGEAKNSGREATIFTSAARIATEQLPTPSSTLPTTIVPTPGASAFIAAVGPFQSQTSIGQQTIISTAPSIFDKSIDDHLQESISIDMSQDAIEQEEEYSILDMALQAQIHLDESSSPSPAPSFDTQLNTDEAASVSDVEEIDGPKYQSENPPAESGSIVSGADEPSALYSEIDEELQVSILESSQLEGLVDEELDTNIGEDSEPHELTDEDLQASILEDSLLEEHSEKNLEANIPEESPAEEYTDEELQASILEDSRLEWYADEELDGNIPDDSSLEDYTDEDLQASILEDSRLEEDIENEVQNNHDESTRIGAIEGTPEPEHSDQVEMMPRWLYDHTPAKQLAEDISAQLRGNFTARNSSSGEDSDASVRNDPSVRLARAANAPKKTSRKRAASTQLYHPRQKRLDLGRSPTPSTDDSSQRLARTSLGSLTPRLEEESDSMTIVKLTLARHLRDELPDCASVKTLRQHLTKSLDVIAVAAMQPADPQRAQGGPREFMMSFTISDYSIGPYAVAEVLIHRAHKETLPVIKCGDVVLLRNFTVVSLANKGFGLKANDGSSWAVFDYENEPAQIKGPPVEYGEREMLYVGYLREWFGLLSPKARSKLERANQQIIEAGRASSGKPSWASNGSSRKSFYL